MPYRDDLEALRQRHDELLSELAALRNEERRLASCRLRLGAVEDELSTLTRRLRDMTARRGGALSLEDVRLASPCSARWDDMVGDDRVRHCSLCDRDVYNVSAMSRAQAEALIADSHHASPDRPRRCLRLFRRHDGTVLTADCPVGRRRRRVTRVVGVLAAGGAAVALMPTSQPLRAHSMDVRGPELAPATTADPLPRRPVHDPDDGRVVMGF